MAHSREEVYRYIEVLLGATSADLAAKCIYEYSACELLADNALINEESKDSPTAYARAQSARGTFSLREEHISTPGKKSLLSLVCS